MYASHIHHGIVFAYWLIYCFVYFCLLPIIGDDDAFDDFRVQEPQLCNRAKEQRQAALRVYQLYILNIMLCLCDDANVNCDVMMWIDESTTCVLICLSMHVVLLSNTSMSRIVVMDTLSWSFMVLDLVLDGSCNCWWVRVSIFCRVLVDLVPTSLSIALSIVVVNETRHVMVSCSLITVGKLKLQLKMWRCEWVHNCWFFIPLISVKDRILVPLNQVTFVLPYELVWDSLDLLIHLILA